MNMKHNVTNSFTSSPGRLWVEFHDHCIKNENVSVRGTIQDINVWILSIHKLAWWALPHQISRQANFNDEFLKSNINFHTAYVSVSCH